MTARMPRRLATSPRAARHLTRCLEEFWPSRRPHAYDEFCPRARPRP
ncbi:MULTISPECIES: hypothetical protein [unclassified Pseudonocardia]|nr:MULTISPECIES: hypothetical protein [unclassified Pseudonocardia]